MIHKSNHRYCYVVTQSEFGPDPVLVIVNHCGGCASFGPGAGGPGAVTTAAANVRSTCATTSDKDIRGSGTLPVDVALVEPPIEVALKGGACDGDSAPILV
jgi:hypothetical protein